MCFLSVSSLLVIRVGLPLFVTFSPMGCPFCRSMCEVSPWLEVFPKNCVCLYSDMIKEQPSVYRTYHPLLPFYSTADRVVLCYKKKITSVELCWSTFITFKCYCVFLLIDEKCLGLIFICFDSAEVALIWNQFALSSLNERVTRGNPGAVTLDWASLQRICRISINVEPGCVFLSSQWELLVCVNTQVCSTRCSYWQAAPWTQNVLQGHKSQTLRLLLYEE